VPSGQRLGAGITSSRLTHPRWVEIPQLEGATASLQSSEVIVNAFGRLKIRLLRRETRGPRRPEGLAAAVPAANVDSDG
jgi:hypothetical protein